MMTRYPRKRRVENILPRNERRVPLLDTDEELAYVYWVVINQENGNYLYKTKNHTTDQDQRYTLCGLAIPDHQESVIEVEIDQQSYYSIHCKRCEAQRAKIERRLWDNQLLDSIKNYCAGATNVNIIEVVEYMASIGYKLHRQKVRALLLRIADQDKTASNVYILFQNKDGE